MPCYFRKMVGSRWKTIEVTDEEIELVTKEYFVKNIMLMERCILNVNKRISESERLKGTTISPQMLENMALSLMDKMVTPLHFAIENYVENKLSKDDSDL